MACQCRYRGRLEFLLLVDKGIKLIGKSSSGGSWGKALLGLYGTLPYHL